MILEAFVAAALNPQRMPRLAELPSHQLRRLVEVQWQELRAVVLRDRKLLRDTQREYRELRDDLHPLLEELSSEKDTSAISAPAARLKPHRRRSEVAAFREERLAIVEALAEADPATTAFRQELLARVRYASEFQRVTERAPALYPEAARGGDAEE